MQVPGFPGIYKSLLITAITVTSSLELARIPVTADKIHSQHTFVFIVRDFEHTFKIKGYTKKILKRKKLYIGLYIGYHDRIWKVRLKR